MGWEQRAFQSTGGRHPKPVLWDSLGTAWLGPRCQFALPKNHPGALKAQQPNPAPGPRQSQGKSHSSQGEGDSLLTGLMTILGPQTRLRSPLETCVRGQGHRQARGVPFATRLPAAVRQQKWPGPMHGIKLQQETSELQVQFSLLPFPTKCQRCLNTPTALPRK